MSRYTPAARGVVLGLVAVLLAARPLQHTVEVTTDGSSPTVPASSGPFEATFDARLERLPFTYTLALRGDPLDVNTMMAAARSNDAGTVITTS